MKSAVNADIASQYQPGLMMLRGSTQLQRLHHGKTDVSSALLCTHFCACTHSEALSLVTCPAGGLAVFPVFLALAGLVGDGLAEELFPKPFLAAQTMHARLPPYSQHSCNVRLPLTAMRPYPENGRLADVHDVPT